MRRQSKEEGFRLANEPRKIKGFWWTWSGSNRRPLPCQGSARPAAPQAHFSQRRGMLGNFNSRPLGCDSQTTGTVRRRGLAGISLVKGKCGRAAGGTLGGAQNARRPLPRLLLRLCKFHHSALGLWHSKLAFGGTLMIDHEKFQKGRMWAYVAGAVIFVVVAAWRFVIR